MTSLTLLSQEDRQAVQTPSDVAIAVWPTELLDEQRTHYLNTETPTIMIFALANPQGRVLSNAWIQFDLPQGVTLSAVNAYLTWNSMTNSAIQRDGTNYTHYEIPCGVHPTTFPVGYGVGGWFQRSRPPALWLSTQLAPGAKPGKVYYRVRYIEAGQSSALSPESWVDLGILPEIEAAQPQIARSGVMGRFIFNVSTTPGMAGMLADYIEQLGYNYYMNGPSQTNAPPGLARWIEGTIQNGFTYVGGATNMPEEIKYVSSGQQFNKALSPWAIYERHPWVVSNVFSPIHADVSNKTYSYVWANWEPYAYMTNGDYSEGSMEEFIAWSELPRENVTNGWPLATIAAYPELWREFRNWELGNVTAALIGELQAAGDEAGVDAEFSIGLSNDAIWGNLPDTDISILPWGDMPYTLQTWTYYYVANSAGEYPITDRCGLVQVARSGGLDLWINTCFSNEHQIRLGCVYGWDQTDGSGFFLPEQLGFLHLSTVFAGMGNAQNYAEWPVWDGRYAREIALANTRIALWEDFILSGIRERTHLVTPVSPYPQTVPDDVTFADQEPQGDVPASQYLFSFEYRKYGDRLITVANTWDFGECFFNIRFPSLPADETYRLSEPEYRRIFANASTNSFLTAQELAGGVLVQVGATRWGAFLLEPASQAETNDWEIVCPAEMESALELAEPDLENLIALYYAKTNTYIGPNSGNWSTDANWSLGHAPLSSEFVRFTNKVATASTVDQNFTINGIMFDSGSAAAITINSSGGSTLTLNSMTKIFNDTGYDSFNLPIVLATNATFVGSAYGGGYYFNYTISGDFTIGITNGMGQYQFLATNAFKGLEIYDGYARFNNGGLGTGPITMGIGNGAGNCILFYNLGGVYNLTTNTVTVQPGTGMRRIYSQTANATTLPLNFVLNTNLALELPVGAQCTLSGAISGSGGIVKDFSVSTGTLAGACAYTGATLVKQGTLTLNGTMSNVNVTIGNPSAAALVNGTGTLSFCSGNLIDVNTNGVLDATALKFDLAGLTANSVVLVDYSHAGTFTAPNPLSSMLTAASQAFRVMTNTAKQVVAMRGMTNTYIGTNNGVWSAAANWSLGSKPLSSECVKFTNKVATASKVDENFTINGIIFDSGSAAAITINSSGGSTLALNSIAKIFNDTGYDSFNVPIVLATNAIFAGSAYGGGYYFNSVISGDFTIALTNGNGQFQLLATNTFKGLNIYSGYARFNNGGLGPNPVTLGSGNGAGNCALFYNLGGVYNLTTNTVTVQSGTGTRTIYTQTANAATLPLNFVLNKDLTFDLGVANAKCTLSGAISGSGGIVKQNGGAFMTTGVLAGACAYTGATQVKQGALTLNGTMSNVNITIGHTNVAALVNGTGTLSFCSGNLIDVNTNGVLDATSLKFDLTGLTNNTAVLVDYSHLGTFTAPSPLSNMLTTASQALFALTNTTGEVTAIRKP